MVAPISEDFAPAFLALAAAELVGGAAERAATTPGSPLCEAPPLALPLQPPSVRAVGSWDQPRVLLPPGARCPYVFLNGSPTPVTAMAVMIQQ